MPHPLRYKLVWKQERGETHLFAWRAVPVSADFVALVSDGCLTAWLPRRLTTGGGAQGMICTNSSEPPPRTAMRCVPVGWTKTSTVAPKKIWDDTVRGALRAHVCGCARGLTCWPQGAGGREGSFWIVNDLGLLHVAVGQRCARVAHAASAACIIAVACRRPRGTYRAVLRPGQPPFHGEGRLQAGRLGRHRGQSGAGRLLCAW
jgi:hypothetical protein